MSRIPQPEGTRGSLKWIQRGINSNAKSFGAEILPKLGGAKAITWRSPLVDDDYAEYRDGEFLSRIGLEKLQTDLAAFWPQRGAQ